LGVDRLGGWPAAKEQCCNLAADPVPPPGTALLRGGARRG
jgi:hypothetical protein